jgi:hypothetical protein
VTDLTGAPDAGDQRDFAGQLTGHWGD